MLKNVMRKVMLTGMVLVLLLTTACQSPAASSKPSAPATAATALAAAASTAPADPAKPVDITVWARVSNQATYEQYAKSFMTANPNIKLKVVGMGSSYDDLMDKLIAGVAAKSYPNISQVAQRAGIPQLYDSGVLVPVEDFMTDKEQNDILPGYWTRYTYKGKRVAIPLEASMPILHYNKTFVEQNKIPIPKTVDELLASAKMCIRDTNNDKVTDIYGLNFPDGVALYYQSMIYSIENGKTEDSSGKPDLLGGPYKKMFEVIKQAVHVDKSMPPNQHKTAQEDFMNGNLIFYIGSCASRGTIEKGVNKKFEYAMATMPCFDKVAAPIGGNGLAIFKSTKEQEAAAYAFLKYMTRPETIADSVVNRGYLPISTSSLNQDIIQKQMKDPSTVIVIDQLKYLKAKNLHPTDAIVWDSMDAITEEVEANPKADIDKQLTKYQADINKFVSDYKK